MGNIQEEYLALDGKEPRRQYFYAKRTLYNEESPQDLMRAALFIFFMKTCYNGIFSVNRKGKLSVTFGCGGRTKILEEELIRINYRLLQGVVILNGDYKQTGKYAGTDAYFYFDPPYKPTNSSNACTSYTAEDFSDPQQIELAGFCKEVEEKGAK